MKIRTMKCKIDADVDRKNMIIALANSGFKTWVEEVERGLSTDAYVCFEYCPPTDE